MLYIVTALKSEAQALVERYKLTKSKLKNFTIYTNTEMIVIVSNMGITNARDATQTLINQFDITDEDIYINLGICGASKKYIIGDLIEIGSLTCEGITYEFKKDKIEIICVDKAIDKDSYEVVDMESYGFYDAVIHSPAIKNFYIFKVVSDHFEPMMVTKDGTKKLILNVLKSVEDIIISSH